MVYRFRNFAYDVTKGEILKEENVFKLTKTQNNLIHYFILNPNKVNSKQELMEKVWGRIVTENSVDQIISILRGHIEENPKDPKIILTHYGQGISFEGQVIPSENKQSQKSTKTNTAKSYKWLAFLVSIIVVGMGYWAFQNLEHESASGEKRATQVLILPMSFTDGSIDKTQQKGMSALLKSTFNTLESEGNIIFDESSLTTQQAVEKHWRIEDELVVIRSNVKKNGDVYQAVIESFGINTNTKTTLSANNLDELLNKQIKFIAAIEQDKDQQKLLDLKNNPINALFIQALGYQNNGNLPKAKDLIQQLLAKQDSHYQARLLLADILYEQKNYDESLAQLNTLKVTSAYQQIGTEIELKLAEVKLAKAQFQELINDLKNYQAIHLSINEIKKAKIQILLGKAYRAMGSMELSLKAYKKALINIDELVNPRLYAQSYYGQAQVISSNANDDKVYNLFNQSYDYAKSAADLHLQVMALNEMAQLKLLQNQWEHAVTLTKKALEVMELTENKEQIAKGLSTLVTILNLRGQLTEAREVNNRLGKISEELDSDLLRLYFLYFDSVLDMNQYKWARAQEQIDKQLLIAKRINNYSMQLNNTFLHLELMLLKKDTKGFKQVWDNRVALIKEKGYERFLVYMDLFLGRYYKQIHEDKKAIDILTRVSEQVKTQNDMKVFTDAQNQLATVYLRSNPQKALDIINNLEQYNPHPNPYLDIKAQALNKLDKNIEALSILNQAKLIYHESWTAENQALLTTIQNLVQ